VAREKITPPAITIVGEVVKLRRQLNWFEQLPLFGKRIVVTRSQMQAGKFSKKLSALGADVLEIPVVKGGLPDNKQDFVDALLALNTYDWLVFTSANGVRFFMDRLDASKHDLRQLRAKICAIGPATRAAVEAVKAGRRAIGFDLSPEFAASSAVAAQQPIIQGTHAQLH